MGIRRRFPNGTDGGEGGRSGATATAAEMESGKQATEEHLPDWPLACSSLAGTEGGEEQEDSDVADGAGW